MCLHAVAVMQTCIETICVCYSPVAHLMVPAHLCVAASNFVQAGMTAAKKQLVNDVLKGRQVPSALARRVRAFFNYESTKLIRDQEDDMLADLPFKLRSRLLQVRARWGFACVRPGAVLVSCASACAWQLGVRSVLGCVWVASETLGGSDLSQHRTRVQPGRKLDGMGFYLLGCVWPACDAAFWRPAAVVFS